MYLYFLWSPFRILLYGNPCSQDDKHLPSARACIRTNVGEDSVQPISHSYSDTLSFPTCFGPMDLVIGLSLANASQILFLLLLFDNTCAIDAKRSTYVVASYHGVH